MTIALSPEQEKVVGQGIEAGIVANTEIALEVGVAAIREQLATRVRRANKLSHEEWSKAFREWIDSHPTDTPLLSDEAISRESIYEGRGL